ncbi:GntR family transcriptional regulator [Streptomyces sp. NPDC052396]|uniref:GntR family transcriptional regulator n=1 Tax=Streptomyces sp. NPDC052396 TaxID=3365689 RepID=UPI0037D42D2D
MPTPKHDHRPPYQQAADAIRREIQTGRLKPGQQLPSHRELQERFNIANMTARSALRVLRDEGLIYTVQGRGSYVADAVEHASPVHTASGQASETEGGPETVQVAPLLEALRSLRDDFRTISAEIQEIRREVDELKAQRHQQDGTA